ncbi:hypothetical protein E4U32_007264 [Claviceps aff. humidiphila group G2b]|nr:hypothetical protein E4U32_007264 [Claviceps aff. humidiphila group G2b]
MNSLKSSFAQVPLECWATTSLVDEPKTLMTLDNRKRRVAKSKHAASGLQDLPPQGPCLQGSNGNPPGDTSTIGDNDTPSNPAHRGNTSARGRLTTPRPSTTRSHRKEDAAASSFERTMNRSTAVLADIARLQERAQERNAVPAVLMGSALTRATARISTLEFVVGLDVRRRMSVIRAMAKDGNADIVLGLRDEDMQPYVEMLLEEMAGPPPAPPQQQQQQYGQYGQDSALSRWVVNKHMGGHRSD